MFAGVIVGAVLLLGLVAAVALVARRFTHAKKPLDAGEIREFFQYILLFGLYVIVGIGGTELLGRVFGAGADSWDTNDYALAQALGFVVIGVPLLAVALWLTSRQKRAKPTEDRSYLYAAYVTVTALTGLVVASSAVGSVLANALTSLTGGGVSSLGASLATVIVWGAIWLTNWLVAERTLTASQNTPHLLIGSLIGVFYLVGGFVTTVGDSLFSLWPAGTIYGVPTAIAGGFGTLLAGILIWARYWTSRAQELERGPLWMIVTLPLGVGGGLVLFLGSISTLAWSVLVWFIGSTGNSSASDHFIGAGSQLAAAVAGALLWWYFRTILGPTFSVSSNARRLYLYLMAGLALGAAAIGTATVVVAAIEALTPSTNIGTSPVNTLLAGLVALSVGGPIWALFWKRATNLDVASVIGGPTNLDVPGAVGEATYPDTTSAGDPVNDEKSTAAGSTRRVYLLLWLWLGALTAVIAAVNLAVTFFQDLVMGSLGTGTLYTARYALGALLAAGTVVAYHAAVYRSEYRGDSAPSREHSTKVEESGRNGGDGELYADAKSPTVLSPATQSPDILSPATQKPLGPRSVLLVGSVDLEVAELISDAMETNVEVWGDADSSVIPAQSDAVLAFLAQNAGRDVLLVGPSQPEAGAEGGPPGADGGTSGANGREPRPDTGKLRAYVR